VHYQSLHEKMAIELDSPVYELKMLLIDEDELEVFVEVLASRLPELVPLAAKCPRFPVQVASSTRLVEMVVGTR
jgi:hypothetical protein